MLLLSIFICYKCFSQNIKCEIADYVQSLDGIEYSTYQYINSSYSYSRPLIVMVTDKNTFMEIHHKIPPLFLLKQEYTDVWVLGINNFNRNKILDTDKKVIDFFIEHVLKYRNDNNLPSYSQSQILSNIIYLNDNSDLCKYLVCKHR